MTVANDLFTAPQIDPLAAIADSPIRCPFVIFTDTREQMPFNFEGMRAGADRSYRPLEVTWEWHCLGNHGGDYSLEHYTGAIRIERKNVDDFHSTILGWPQKGEPETGRCFNFQKELANLNQMQFAAVVVEASWEEMMDTVCQWGKHTADENRKFIEGFVRSFKHHFTRVHWEFHRDRRAAEIATFNHLRYFWNKKIDAARERYRPRKRFVGKKI